MDWDTEILANKYGMVWLCPFLFLDDSNKIAPHLCVTIPKNKIFLIECIITRRLILELIVK
jgi:hypothetical protein